VSEPRFSIITPVYETPAGVLRAMLRSVRRQRFRDWELCLVDDASSQPHVAGELEAAQRCDARIRVHRRSSNGGIVAASNEALEMARGEFVALLDHDDKLHPDALALVAEALDDQPTADYVYTDEDKIDRLGLHSGPFCKPDWSPERMRTQMYTCHLSVLRRALVEQVGGFDPQFEGSQDWDLVLKVTERARSVVHIPRVLYHWRALETSAAGGGESAKPWAFEAGQRAVQAHCDRIGLEARVDRDETLPGVYHLRPALTHQPTVSIVIPTNGQKREVRYQQVPLVENCVRSIVETSTYANCEIVCVADSSTAPSVIANLTAAAGDRLRVVTYDREFNFSAKINLGAIHSEGDLLLLLNDDMEVLTPDWIERLAMYAQHPGIGAVGGRLLWEDGRLQHAGVLFENGGLPGHIYRGFRGNFKGYANNTHVAQNFLAVTGACMMTPAAAFHEAGGFAETLPVNYNDMDYCLKLRTLGLRVVYDPDTVLYHFESSSRSSDVEDWEKEELIARWLPMTAVDPSTNPYLVHGMPRLRAHFAWASRRFPPLSTP
jgi:GT2 family glycosyltransferase